MNDVVPRAVSAVIKGNNFDYLGCIKSADNSRNPRFLKGKGTVNYLSKFLQSFEKFRSSFSKGRERRRESELLPETLALYNSQRSDESSLPSLMLVTSPKADSGYFLAVKNELAAENR